jgi:hypothetical protein
MLAVSAIVRDSLIFEGRGVKTSLISFAAPSFIEPTAK